MFDLGLSIKLIVLLTLGQAIKKLVINEDLVTTTRIRDIMSISHAMTMTRHIEIKTINKIN